jgi:hypothetical protein
MTDPFDIPQVEIPRDRYGRPMILPPKGGKRVPYRRCTTFVGCLEDTYNIMLWKQRQTVLGMGQRPDLILAAAAADPDDKELLNELAEKATEYALASSAATTGTALHALTERLDRGQPIGYVPPEYSSDLDAYQNATAGIRWEGTDLGWVGIESFRVHDDFKVAGTADRIGWHNGRLRIFDIKTGTIDYPHKMVMQLAMYAHSVPYDIATDKRGQDPEPVDLNTAIIIHLPAGEGTCDLYEIDIAKGWGACLLARQVWDWRATKDLTHRIGDERKTVWEHANNPDRGEQLLQLQLDEVTSIEELRALWHTAAANGALTSYFRVMARRRSQQLTA